MLTGLNPLLVGTLLQQLDAMGHGDTVLVCDAHFPAARLVSRVVEIPAADAVSMTEAILSVLPLDVQVSAELMDPSGVDAPAYTALRSACSTAAGDVNSLERYEFYESARGAFVAVRTGERRVFGNILLHKGVVR